MFLVITLHIPEYRQCYEFDIFQTIAQAENYCEISPYQTYIIKLGNLTDNKNNLVHYTTSILNLKYIFNKK